MNLMLGEKPTLEWTAWALQECARAGLVYQMPLWHPEWGPGIFTWSDPVVMLMMGNEL